MSYKDVAMLTRLRIEMPQMTKKDKKATASAEEANNAHNAGHYRKDLYPKHLVDPIVQVASQARGYLYSQTRPYGFTGAYLLPNSRIMGFLDTMGKYELQFNQTVTAFLNNWSNVLLQAQDTQGDLFDPTAYPDLSVLRAQFVFEYPLTPIAEARDAILSELDEHVQQQIIAKTMRDEETLTAGIIGSALQDLREQVLRIAKVTTVTKAKDKAGNEVEKSGKIYDTLTQEIANLTGLLADLNYGGSGDLASLAETIDMHLTIPPDALRGDLEVCRITNKKANEILQQMEAFL